MKQAPWIIIILMLVALIITRECNRPDHFADSSNMVADTIYRTDTIKGDSIPVPYPVVEIKTVDCTRIVEVPANVDTAAILAAYFSENYYTNYPIVDDSNVFVSLDAMVSENRLRWVVPYVQIRRPQVINHYTTVIQEAEQRNKLFAGLGIGRSLNSFGLAPSLALLTKRQSLYSIHYDVMNKDVYFTMYFKIR